MRGTTNEAAQAVHQLFVNTYTVSLRLAAMFKAAWPDEYPAYQAAFEAGRWQVQDPGPWLGRAILYKLQVELHADHHDGLKEDDFVGPTASFCVGNFTGGPAFFPDLNTKLL
jgi:hypothetical protein